jgi:hypothetical protein
VGILLRQTMAMQLVLPLVQQEMIHLQIPKEVQLTQQAAQRLTKPAVT